MEDGAFEGAEVDAVDGVGAAVNTFDTGSGDFGEVEIFTGGVDRDPDGFVQAAEEDGGGALRGLLDDDPGGAAGPVDIAGAVDGDIGGFRVAAMQDRDGTAGDVELRDGVGAAVDPFHTGGGDLREVKGFTVGGDGDAGGFVQAGEEFGGGAIGLLFEDDPGGFTGPVEVPLTIDGDVGGFRFATMEDGLRAGFGVEFDDGVGTAGDTGRGNLREKKVAILPDRNAGGPGEPAGDHADCVGDGVMGAGSFGGVVSILNQCGAGITLVSVMAFKRGTGHQPARFERFAEDESHLRANRSRGVAVGTAGGMRR